jgi:hypothetical protein
MHGADSYRLFPITFYLHDFAKKVQCYGRHCGSYANFFIDFYSNRVYDFFSLPEWGRTQLNRVTSISTPHSKAD